MTALLPLGILVSLNAVLLEVARLLTTVAYFRPWCPGWLVSQLSLQLSCLHRQSHYLGPQLPHFLAVLGLSHQDLLCSHLHISILAHPALSLSPCLMEDDIIMLHGVATNVATEGSIKSIKWSQSIAGLTASACAAFSLVVSISRCCTYPATLSPIPCCRPWNEVSRAERPQWSPKVAAKTAKTWTAVSASPAAWVSTSLLGRSLQCLDQPLHCCPILHLEVPEDALCLLNKFIGVAAIHLSSEVW